MSKALLVALALVFALSAGVSARSFGTPNVLINGSWQTGNIDGSPGWTKSLAKDTGYVHNLITGMGNWGRAPGETDDYGWGDESNWWYHNVGWIYQDYTIFAPDMYTMELSAWLAVFDDSALPTYVELQLWVDGVLPDENKARLERAGGGGTGWQLYSIQWTGYVVQTVRARLEGKADGQGGWGLFIADGVDLEFVPEPGTFVALGAGLLGLALRRRR